MAENVVLIFEKNFYSETMFNLIYMRVSYLATAKNANSTLSPVFAEVSIKVTLYSRANRSPSSRFTCRSGQSALFPRMQDNQNSIKYIDLNLD